MRGPTRRLLGSLFIVFVAGCGVALILLAFRENLLYFYYPDQLVQGEVAVTGRNIRVGGLVVPESMQRDPHSLAVRFRLTDHRSELEVLYTGVLPSLFREGQGAIALGRLGPDGRFAATEVLARHDENYVPPELAELMPPTSGAPAGAQRY